MASEAEHDSPGHDLGRNDRCHCGSGKKYKQCCLRADEAAASEARAQQAKADAEAAEAEAAEDGSDAEETHETHRKAQRAPTHQPWKRDSQAAVGSKKRTLPRKVGS